MIFVSPTLGVKTACFIPKLGQFTQSYPGIGSCHLQQLSARQIRHSHRALPLNAYHTQRSQVAASAHRVSSTFCNCHGGSGVESPSDKEQGLAFLISARHFINLTNGIEALPVLQELGLPYSFVRIQSTACEQQNFEQLLNGLDSTFLLSLALGETCIVYDFGSRNKKRGVPRAIWYGVEFIRFALDYIWFGDIKPAVLRGHNVEDTFKVHVNNLSKSTKKKLKYYRQYIPEHCHQTQILGIYGPTVHDPDNIFYRDLLWQCQVGAASLGGMSPLRDWPASPPSINKASCSDVDDPDDSPVSNSKLKVHSKAEDGFKLEEMLELVFEPYQLQVFRRGIPHWEWKAQRIAEEAATQAPSDGGA